MEILLLYLDSLDDLVGAAGLKFEMVRRVVLRLTRVVAIAVAGALLVVVGAAEPALGLGAATFVYVLWFYQRVTSPRMIPQEA